MEETEHTLTIDDLKRGVKALLDNNNRHNPPMYVESQNFYLSEAARQMGFGCTREELDNTVDGYIKTVRDVRLYLSKHLPHTGGSNLKR